MVDKMLDNMEKTSQWGKETQKQKCAFTPYHNYDIPTCKKIVLVELVIATCEDGVFLRATNCTTSDSLGTMFRHFGNIVKIIPFTWVHKKSLCKNYKPVHKHIPTDWGCVPVRSFMPFTRKHPSVLFVRHWLRCISAHFWRNPCNGLNWNILSPWSLKIIYTVGIVYIFPLTNLFGAAFCMYCI